VIADPVMHHRVVPRRGMFRVESVSAAGAVELVATYPTEHEALEELRVFQLAADRAEAAMLALVDGPKGPRGSIILPPECPRERRRRRRLQEAMTA
jgi:hypothetical protein